MTSAWAALALVSASLVSCTGEPQRAELPGQSAVRRETRSESELTPPRKPILNQEPAETFGTAAGRVYPEQAPSPRDNASITESKPGAEPRR